ncbi:MAG: hypothetical protein JRE81_08650 [Deltaproteobacteria bacterium]|nr:hypothetical protein [Deltaproteobacteria bacterium]
MSRRDVGTRHLKTTVRKTMLCVVVPCLLLAAGCRWRHGAPEGSPGHVSEANQACATLFCSSDEQLETDGRCTPSCMCGRYTFVEPRYDEHDTHALRSWRLLNPVAPLAGDPFSEPSTERDETQGYCAAVPVDPSPHARTYRLQTFPTERSARAAGGQVTHSGRCGACSSFQDLAVYIEQKDLNRAGRLCGLRGTLGSKGQLTCFKKLGFTEACAQIWSFNVDHTRSECMGSCMATIPTKHKRPDGSLNPCLACDEENSGPVFKAVAGRTRRASGLSSAIARPCLDGRGEPAVYPVEHYYFSQRPSRARN